MVCGPMQDGGGEDGEGEGDEASSPPPARPSRGGQLPGRPERGAAGPAPARRVARQDLGQDRLPPPRARRSCRRQPGRPQCLPAGAARRADRAREQLHGGHERALLRRRWGAGPVRARRAAEGEGTRVPHAAGEGGARLSRRGRGRGGGRDRERPAALRLGGRELEGGPDGGREPQRRAPNLRAAAPRRRDGDGGGPRRARRRRTALRPDAPRHGVLVSGGLWAMDEPLGDAPGLVAARPPRADHIPAIARALSDDVDFDLPEYYRRGVGDTYFSGKQLAKARETVGGGTEGHTTINLIVAE
ncbi:hypothetical protein THAOC_13958 [Thalassiosira oceanica]|uniref:Uncharacterized protein n=1 Tax=Thalassiosira oceanica TaxID=159749 RepID=K0SW80_THAOC|nr:hypothetical protein THAOC_13958 [Thalassiosira oceanica]|eukprot:EJK65211.1 hypothetical protein THAOC_13958 [Thalassiosira oceanica]